ncbi:hypothetical protein N7528_009039 [Penicillium herquei]|nr:hypothetical protein N7528_009039 [Penicillium herquei]
MASNRSALRGYLRDLRVPLRRDIVDIYLALYRDGSDDPDGPPRAAIWVLFAYGLMTVWMTANQSVHAVFWESMARPESGILEPTALYHVGSISVGNFVRLVGWILLYVNPEKPRETSVQWAVRNAWRIQSRPSIRNTSSESRRLQRFHDRVSHLR